MSRESGPGRGRPVAAAVVLAGGSGTRLGADRNKVLLPLAGRPVIAHAVQALTAAPEVGPVILVRRTADAAEIDAVFAELPVRPTGTAGSVECVDGGRTRQESELAGLRALAGRIATGAVDVVLVHDGARPFVAPELVAGVLAAARAHGGAVPGLLRDDLAVVGPGTGTGLGRESLAAPAPVLLAVQTPQGFRAAPLLAACEAATAAGFAATDTASCVTAFSSLTVVAVPGSERNLKITVAHDLEWARRLAVAADLDLRRGSRPSDPSDRAGIPAAPSRPG